MSSGTIRRRKGFEIAQHVGRGVLLDQERGRSVRDVDGEQARRDVLAFGPVPDLGSDLLDLVRRGVDREAGLGNAHRDPFRD
jgi:hypothetical protein